MEGAATPPEHRAAGDTRAQGLVDLHLHFSRCDCWVTAGSMPWDMAAEAAAACFPPTIGNKDSKLPPSLATLVFLVIVVPWASRCGCDSFP